MAVALPRRMTPARAEPDPSGHGRPAMLAQLRGAIAAAEGRTPGLETGLAGMRRAMPGRIGLDGGALDAALGGGWPVTGLGELHAGAARDAGALSGFATGVLALLSRARPGPVFWILAGTAAGEAGLPYGPGLADLGLDPGRLLLAAPRRLADALWIAEEAAGCAGLCAVVLELRAPAARPDLKETRRLHLRAGTSGLPLLLLRHDGAPAPPTAAPVRLSILPSPAGTDVGAGAGGLPGAIGPPGFCIRVERNRSGPSGGLHHLVWKSHERRFLALAPSGAPAASGKPGHAAAGDRACGPGNAPAADRVAAFPDASHGSQPSRSPRRGLAVGRA